MFPGVDGFAWDAGHIIFLGAFFSVLTVIAITLMRIALRARRDRQPARAAKIEWHADFSELPADQRRCRHELAGQVQSRRCPNEFDCRSCGKHPEFVAQFGAAQPSHSVEEVAGLRLPLDRLYHRGHAWAKLEADGSYTVGLDDLGSAVIGPPDALELPAPGTRVFANSPAWVVRRGADRLRVLSPIDGEVVETNTDEGAWRLRIRPAANTSTAHLLAGTEAAAWFRREFERLQAALGDPGLGIALADGGAMVDDLPGAYPKVDWERVRGAVLLEP